MHYPALPRRRQTVTQPINSVETDHAALTRFVEDELPAASIETDCPRLACGNGLLWDGETTVDECWANQESRQKWIDRRGRLKYAASSWIGRRDTIDQPTLWITDNWSGGYFHWIAEALCRLEMASQIVDLREHTLVLPAKFGRRGFVAKSLAMFDIGKVRILGDYERLQCSRMTVPTHATPSGNFREEILDRLRDRIRQHAESTHVLGAPTDRRIYLSRRKAGRRCIVNESELIPILKRHGFEIWVPEDMTWQTQIQTLMGTSRLVSNHGAALTNMIAMNPGGHVLEMRHRMGGTPNCFLTMASALKLSFQYQMVDSTDAKKSVYHGDMRVDVNVFEQMLRQMSDHFSTPSRAA